MGGGDSRLATISHSRPAPNRRRPSQVKTKATITWDEFAACVRNVNAKCRGLRNDRNEYFVFGISNETTTLDEWKDRIAIVCVAVTEATQQYRVAKRMDLKTFLNLYYTFVALFPRVKARSQSQADSTHSSSTAEETDGEETSSIVDEENRCCVCLDRISDSVLPCLHSFCSVCIVQWSEYRTDFHCPLCKASVAKPVLDSWDITEQPDEQEFIKYITNL